MKMSIVCCVLVLALCGGCTASFSLKDDVLRFESKRVKNHHDKQYYSDCHKVRHVGGYTESGVYSLRVNESFAYKLHCEFTPSNSYTVIQRRLYGTENFYRGFHDYVYGFGHSQGDYWAGLNQIYYLTQTGNTVLTIYLQNWAGQYYTLRYKHFSLLDNVHFRLNIQGYQGNLTDDLSFNNGMYFATYDKPDHNNCAVQQHAGWWYNYCSYTLLNGHYYYNGPYTPTGGYYDGIYYKDWMGYGYSLKSVHMSLSNY